MMYAIGQPSQGVRIYVEASDQALAQAQMQAGEIIVETSRAADGTPLIATMPATD